MAARGARYQNTCDTLVRGMRNLGFETLLPDEEQAPIIVTFLEPEGVGFDFDSFYSSLRDRGFAIYPGKLTERATFRVGCIGQVSSNDIERFVAEVSNVLADCNVVLST